ncbi:MAG: hypothetical protein CME13_20235 [Gemmatimonadetes bacterium]|jgi:hypothetical protein|nr:hypothetical protein [Gemmatimonadota bacterium]HCV23895.1 hypothetical protein [Candidatus Latescibacterota bacterium]|tara:strand:- start:356 stop:1129 length:774 start_codon:yes stop_codon:yes gene_type:complete
MVVGISFLAPSLSAWAESLPASTDSLVMRGVECGYNFDDRAFDDFDEVIRREPDHPRGYFLKASGFFWRVLVHPSDQDARAMMRDFSQQAIDRAEARLDRDDDDVEGLFYLGAAAGNLGCFYGMEDRWLKAYWHGRRGENALLSLVEIDPDYNDAYLGLGIYHYYSAVLPKIVRTLSYVMGNRSDKNLGLQQLQHAAKEGTLASRRVGCRDPELLAPARPTPRSHLLGVDIDGLPVSETTLEYCVLFAALSAPSETS